MTRLFLIALGLLAASCHPHETVDSPATAEGVRQQGLEVFEAEIVSIVDDIRFRPITWAVTVARQPDGQRFTFRVLSKHPFVDDIGYVAGIAPLTRKPGSIEEPLLRLTLRMTTAGRYDLVEWQKLP